MRDVTPHERDRRVVELALPGSPDAVLEEFGVLVDLLDLGVEKHALVGDHLVHVGHTLLEI